MNCQTILSAAPDWRTGNSPLQDRRSLLVTDMFQKAELSIVF